MDHQLIDIKGDTPGQVWQLSVLRFKPQNNVGPGIYLQGALHADELPGTAALHYLSLRLREIEENDPGAICGNITIVPSANPIGLAQSLFGQPQGRFDNSDRENFNRDFPRIDFSKRAKLTEPDPHASATQRLKAALLAMALEHDIVLDLHCEDEGQQYAYLDQASWPGAADLAQCLNLDAVLLSDGFSTAFEEAVAFAFASAPPGAHGARLASTLELRGQSDVYPATAKQHAEQLETFLAGRGILARPHAANKEWTGPAVSLDNIAIVRAPKGGTILFHVDVGDTVTEGQHIATLLTNPGISNGEPIEAPAAGTILSRSLYRFARIGDQLVKIVCPKKVTTGRKPGALEA